MTNTENAQLILKTALESISPLGLPCLLVIGVPEEGKVVSFGGGLDQGPDRALIAGAAMGILHKASAKAVVAKPPRGFKLAKTLPPETPFPDQQPPNGS